MRLKKQVNQTCYFIDSLDAIRVICCTYEAEHQDGVGGKCWLTQEKKKRERERERERERWIGSYG